MVFGNLYILSSFLWVPLCHSFLKTSLPANWGKHITKCCRASHHYSSCLGFSFFFQIHNITYRVFIGKFTVAKLLKKFVAYHKSKVYYCFHKSLPIATILIFSNMYYMLWITVMHKPLLFQICTLLQNYVYHILLSKGMYVYNIIFMHMCLSSWVLWRSNEKLFRQYLQDGDNMNFWGGRITTGTIERIWSDVLWYKYGNILWNPTFYNHGKHSNYQYTFIFTLTNILL